MALAKLTTRTRETLRRLQQPGSGLSHLREPAADVYGPLILAEAKTPLVPGTTTGSSGNTAEVELLGPDNDDAPYDRSALYEDVWLQPASDQIVVIGDWSRWLVEGSRVRLIDSTSNDGFYELSGVPTYDSDLDETTITLTVGLPDQSRADGKVARYGPWGLIAAVAIHNVSGQMGVAAMPGDRLLIAQVGREFIAVVGSQSIFGQVATTIKAPTIDVDDEYKLTLGSGTVSVYYFDKDNVRTDTGVVVEIYNDWEDVNIREDYTIKAEWHGRWMLSQASCAVTGASLA
jgi:hypothetical protein